MLHSTDAAIRVQQAKLCASQEHLSTTLRSMGDGVIACDLEGKVTSLNRMAEILTGWTSTEAAGRPIAEVFNIIHAKTRDIVDNGHRWQAQLESGEYASLEDLAKDVGCDRTYVGRMLRLTSLAPDIIEAILRGNEPDGLSLEKLRKPVLSAAEGNLPVRWEEQREEWR